MCYRCLMAIGLSLSLIAVASAQESRAAKQMTLHFFSEDQSLQLSADSVKLTPAVNTHDATKPEDSRRRIQIQLVGRARITIADDIVIEAQQLSLQITEDCEDVIELRGEGECRWRDDLFHISCNEIRFSPKEMAGLTFKGHVRALNREKNTKFVTESLVVENGKLIAKGVTKIDP